MYVPPFSYYIGIYLLVFIYINSRLNNNYKQYLLTVLLKDTRPVSNVRFYKYSIAVIANANLHENIAAQHLMQNLRQRDELIQHLKINTVMCNIIICCWFVSCHQRSLLEVALVEQERVCCVPVCLQQEHHVPMVDALKTRAQSHLTASRLLPDYT